MPGSSRSPPTPWWPWAAASCRRPPTRPRCARACDAVGPAAPRADRGDAAGAGWPRDARVVDSVVGFARLTDAQIDAYAACGEGEGKAGGYAIQGLPRVHPLPGRQLQRRGGPAAVRDGAVAARPGLAAAVTLVAACSPGEIRVAAVQDGVLVDYAIWRPGRPDGVGDVHRGRVTAVVPGMAGAFVALAGADGFLPDSAGAAGRASATCWPCGSCGRPRAARARAWPPRRTIPARPARACCAAAPTRCYAWRRCIRARHRGRSRGRRRLRPHAGRPRDAGQPGPTRWRTPSPRCPARTSRCPAACAR